MFLSLPWSRLRIVGAVGLLGMLVLGASTGFAEETLADKLKVMEDNGNILWVCLAAFLVFFMQAGFALVEAGMTRAKNVCNIMMKNLLDFCMGSLAFWLIGFGLMFGLSKGGWIGIEGFLFDPEAVLSSGKSMAATVGKSVGFSWAFLIFQTVFAATAATIISGAMAERTKFSSYLIYSVVITAFIYPIFGHWAWGNLFFGDNTSWLMNLGFIDFAGSTVVHSVGGWAALAGAIVLGPRLGKYKKDGSIRPIPGHNMGMAALGVFVLWLGWFGFNPGSTTALGGDMARIAVVTNLAAATGAVCAMVASWVMFKKPDTSMSFNGALAGLVGITAGCANMTPAGAVAVGIVCGIAVVFAVLFFDKIRVDDPVGAISVHGVCGAIGTLLVGLWGVDYAKPASEMGIGLFNGGGAAVLKVQVYGVLAAFALVFPLMFGVFYAIKSTVGLRVSEKEELEGLDLHEHGNQAYPVDAVGAPIEVIVPVGGSPIPASTLRPSKEGAGS